MAALLAAGGAQAQGAQPRSGYPVGWNGLAETPPLGWRSWNAWNTRVSQANMEQTIDALVAKVWTMRAQTARPTPPSWRRATFQPASTKAGRAAGWV